MPKERGHVGGHWRFVIGHCVLGMHGPVGGGGGGEWDIVGL